jgi:RNA polymerase sigma factor (sigma-70 family)
VRTSPESAPQVEAERTSGLPDDFTVLYDHHFADIYHYIAGRLGRDVADDIAADTFLIAFRKRGSFNADRGAVRPWLFGIATNLVAAHRRKETRRYRALARVRTDHVTEGHESRVIDWVAAEGLAPQLAKALTALSRGDRDVLLLCALSGLSHGEIAQALDIPYGTVGSRLNRARKKVRAALGNEGLHG